MSGIAPCLKCRSEISTDATRCPKCGYEPSKKRAGRQKWAIGIGAVLTITVIGAVVGIPLILLGLLGRFLARNRKPTAHEP